MSRFLYNPSPAKMCQLYTCCVCLTTCGPLSPTLHTVTDTRDTACLHPPFTAFPAAALPAAQADTSGMGANCTHSAVMLSDEAGVALCGSSTSSTSASAASPGLMPRSSATDTYVTACGSDRQPS